VSPEFFRSFAVKSFQNVDKDKAHDLWKQIQGTQWEHDQDIVKAAFGSGMDVRSMDTPLLHDFRFMRDLFLTYRYRRDLLGRL